MNRTRGFTIIELMTVVAVLGVALAIGVPSMSSFLLNNRLVSHLNSLSSTLTLARSEAVKRNQWTVVCGSSNGTTCVTDGKWETGWIAFVDRTTPHVIPPVPDFTAGVDGCAENAPAGEDCLLIAEAALPGAGNVGQTSGQLMSLRGGTSIGNFIVYSGSGTPRCGGVDCVNVNTYFTICDHRGASHAHALAISKTGRASVIETRLDGSALTCP